MKKQESENKTQGEKYAEERKGEQLLNAIITKTYSRHALMSETEFLEEIGFGESGKSEDEAVRIAVSNLLIEMTSTLFKIKNSINYVNEMLKIYLLNDGSIEQK